MGVADDIPDVDESYTLIVVYCRDPDLSEDDRPVCGRCAGDKDEVSTDVKVRYFVVRDTCCA